jgi:phosphatidylglycerol:prolipoprotein diacylglycerol transferase
MFTQISLLGKTIPTYSLAAAVGIIAAVFYAKKRVRNEYYIDLDRHLELELVCALAGTAAGAKILYLLIECRHVIADIGEYGLAKAGYSYLAGGFVFYGGLIGAMAGLAFIGKYMKRNVTEMLNFAIPSFAAFHALGRIGCFLDGCCYGLEWEHGFACRGDFLCFPIQLVEAAGIVIIFVILMLLERYNKKSGKNIPMVPTYFLLYGVLRFIDEFWRGDILRGVTTVTLDYSTSTYTGGISFDISTSQVISLILIVYSVVVLTKFFKKNNTSNEKTAD